MNNLKHNKKRCTLWHRTQTRCAMSDQPTNPTFLDILCATIRSNDVVAFEDTQDVGPHKILGEMTQEEMRLYKLALDCDCEVKKKHTIFLATPFLSRGREKMGEELETLKEDLWFFKNLFCAAMTARFDLPDTPYFSQLAIVGGHIAIKQRQSLWKRFLYK